ncbi:MAG: type II toxin-antitoxin system VapC family toxin [Gammaproteobacteria bacterium]|nr:type II toxin-antitoxin system VapC family toxin [Gammaproteobacteria bacterium]
MKPERLFLDTAFVQALLNKNDSYHTVAKALLPKLRAAAEVWTTEAILVEVGNALSAIQRQAASRFIEHCYTTPNMQIVNVDTTLLHKALTLYRERNDTEKSAPPGILVSALPHNPRFAWYRPLATENPQYLF